MKNRKRITRLCLELFAAALLGFFLWWNNAALVVSETVIPAPIEGEIRLVQLSDVHGAWFGRGQARIAAKVRGIQPDVIVITGDLIDRFHDDEAAYALIREMAKIAPSYIVTGNHEKLEENEADGSYDRLLKVIEETENAYLLRGETVELMPDVTLTGADDVSFAGGLGGYPEYLKGLSGQAGEDFSILLAHRPEMMERYAAAGFSLTLSGHAHGGQIRLPFIGGLYAPGQGARPEYTSGLYEIGEGSMMYVNRGLGNSVFPFRLFNRPEIAVLTITGEK